MMIGIIKETSMLQRAYRAARKWSNKRSTSENMDKAIKEGKFDHDELRELSVEEEQIIGRHTVDSIYAIDEVNSYHGVVDVFGPYTIQLQDSKRRLVPMPKWLKGKEIKPNTYQKGPRGGMYYYVSKDEVYLIKS